ncbi:MAG: patatin-like phospholipase family protein [Anaerolineales bacterium]|nr:patatin-like phospholipase family protein [Chloroflexota bacterium]MBL6983459.1 patatin-like phospholipase family protein [Anaerolineales bacterium]
MMDINLALGGGGSKGNAHIGVLRVLEREGFRVRAVAGTSAGGMAAAAYAAGCSPGEIEAHMSSIDQSKLYSFHLGGEPSLLGIDGVEKALYNLLGERTFNELEIPCALTAVDLISGRKVVLKEGRVMDAVLATVAIPGIYPAKKLDDQTLVDGGVLDPVPVSVARAISPNPRLPVVAVVLTPATNESELPDSHQYNLILNRIARTRIAKAFEIYFRSIEIGTSAITELRLQIDAPEVIIRPDVSKIGYLDRVDVSRVVKLGEQAAEAALPELRKFTGWRGRVRRLF